MLEAQIVKKRRELNVAVSFQMQKATSLGLFGASGAGKSTVLACIAGVEEPDSGCVRLGDLQLYPPSLPLHQRPLGYLTQEPNLFPHLTVRENAWFGVSGNLAADGEQVQWMRMLRDRLQLQSIWEAPASRISGGQARRVGLARMLARKPSLILLDEPFAGLDRQIVRELIDDLRFWGESLGFSMIAVDHQAEVLKKLCPDRVIALEGGKIIQEGRWEEIYAAPATALLRALLMAV